MKKYSVIALIFVGLLSGCQSTNQQAKFEKEEVLSDYALMLSLAARPQTQDEMMMNLFARRSYRQNNNALEMYYLPQGQENPINFVSFTPFDGRPSLPATVFNPQATTISLLGPSNQL